MFFPWLIRIFLLLFLCLFHIPPHGSRHRDDRRKMIGMHRRRRGGHRRPKPSWSHSKRVRRRRVQSLYLVCLGASSIETTSVRCDSLICFRKGPLTVRTTLWDGELRVDLTSWTSSPLDPKEDPATFRDGPADDPRWKNGLQCGLGRSPEVGSMYQTPGGHFMLTCSNDESTASPPSPSYKTFKIVELRSRTWREAPINRCPLSDHELAIQHSMRHLAASEQLVNASIPYRPLHQ